VSFIHNAIYTRLTNFAGLQALVSTRIYYNHAPQQATYPCVIFTRITTRHVQDYQGKGGLGDSIFQIDSLGLEKNTLESIAEQVRLALQGYAATVLGVRLYGIEFFEDLDAPYDPDALLLRVAQRFRVWHTESEPA
jgi:hypothetical protein